MIKRFVLDLFHSIMRHNIGSLAAVIAFFGFSSLLPVLALLIYLASFLVPEATVARFFQGILLAYVPTLPTGQTFAKATVEHLTTYETSISVMGIIGLLWGTIGGFVTLQQILDTIYEVRQRRSFFLQYVIAFAMMGILLTLTLASSLAASVTPGFMAILTHDVSIGGLRLVREIGRVMFPLILFVTCYSCYRILPSRPLSFGPTITGALLATIAIYVSRALYIVYTYHLGNYQVMYGALTFVMLLMFWIYIVCVILLSGAEVACAIQRIRKEP